MGGNSLESQAYAPLDYSGFQDVAKSVVTAGQGIGSAMEGFAAFEKSKDKEALRIQAINEILAKKPHLAKQNGGTLDQNTQLEDLGRGLSQMGVMDVLYDQAVKVGLDNLPDKNQFEQAVFNGSPNAVASFQAEFEKKIAEAEKSGSQKKSVGEVQEFLKTVPPNSSQEEINMAAAKAGINLKDYPGVAPLAGLGQKQKEIDTKEIQDARLRVAWKALAEKSKKMAKDSTFQEMALAVKTAVASGNFANARQSMYVGAKKLAAEAQVLRHDKFNDTAATEMEDAAEALTRAADYAEGREDFLSNIAGTLGELVKEKAAGKEKGAEITPNDPGNPPSTKTEWTMINGIRVRKKPDQTK